MITAIILISLGAIALTLFLIEKVRRYSLKATIIKSIASFLADSTRLESMSLSL